MNTQSITLSVPDMHCESCPKVISMDLEEQLGVVSVSASLQDKQVKVEFDPSKISTQKIINTIKESGYTAKLS